MDVTKDINSRVASYGARPSGAPQYTAVNKTLDFASQGASINHAVPEPVSVLPVSLGYKDVVGLFGVENAFVKLDLKIKNIKFSDDLAVQNDYRDATIIYGPSLTFNDYTDPFTDPEDDLVAINTYEPAELSNKLAEFPNAVVSVDLTNLKTGNKYIDAWLDVTLYNRRREEHPYDRMYVKLDDIVYLGFHARNTKRLPYNVKVVVGEIFADVSQLPPEERKYVVA